MKYLLFSILLLSCHSKKNSKPQWPLTLEDGQQVIIETNALGCFHYEHYRTKIKREKDCYDVLFNERRQTDRYCPYLECFGEFTLRAEAWNKAQVDSFFSLIKMDSIRISTSSASHHVIIGKDTLDFNDSGNPSQLIAKYYRH